MTVYLRSKNVQESIIASAATIRLEKEKWGWKGKVLTVETLEDSAFFILTGHTFCSLFLHFPIFSSLKMIVIRTTQ